MWCLKELIPASFFLHVWHSMCVYSDTCPRWFVWACVTWFCLIYLFDYCCIFLSADGVVNSAFFAFDSSGGSYHSSLLCMLSIWMLYFIFKKGHQINGKPSCVRLCTEQVCVCVETCLACRCCNKSNSCYTLYFQRWSPQLTPLCVFVCMFHISFSLFAPKYRIPGRFFALLYFHMCVFVYVVLSVSWQPQQIFLNSQFTIVNKPHNTLPPILGTFSSVVFWFTQVITINGQPFCVGLFTVYPSSYGNGNICFLTRFPWIIVYIATLCLYACIYVPQSCPSHGKCNSQIIFLLILLAGFGLHL